MWSSSHASKFTWRLFINYHSLVNSPVISCYIYEHCWFLVFLLLLTVFGKSWTGWLPGNEGKNTVVSWLSRSLTAWPQYVQQKLMELLDCDKQLCGNIWLTITFDAINIKKGYLSQMMCKNIAPIIIEQRECMFECPVNWREGKIAGYHNLPFLLKYFITDFNEVPMKTMIAVSHKPLLYQQSIRHKPLQIHQKHVKNSGWSFSSVCSHSDCAAVRRLCVRVLLAL